MLPPENAMALSPQPLESQSAVARRSTSVGAWLLVAMLGLLSAPTGCVVNPVPTPGIGGEQNSTLDAGKRGDKDDNGAVGESDSQSPTAGPADAWPPAADAGAAMNDAGANDDVPLAEDASDTDDAGLDSSAADLGN